MEKGDNTSVLQNEIAFHTSGLGGGLLLSY